MLIGVSSYEKIISSVGNEMKPHFLSSHSLCAKEKERLELHLQDHASLIPDFDKEVVTTYLFGSSTFHMDFSMEPAGLAIM